MGKAGGQKTPRRRRRKLTFDYVSFMAVFLGLPLAIFIIFVISPFVQAAYYSLTDWSGFSQTMNFIGVQNYINLFQDDQFLKAMGNNIFLAILVPLITLSLALLFATMITVGGPSHGQTRGLKGSSFYRVVSFFPYVIPGIIIGLMWAQIFGPDGLVNGFLQMFGLNMFESFPWLGDERTAMGVSIFVIIWGFVGFYMVLFIASIKGIPAETFEAVRLDGAGRFRTAVSITIPLIRDNIQTAYIYVGIMALDAFVYMAALNPNGGPANSTLVMSQYLFEAAFSHGKFGYASAMGVILAIITLLFAAIVFTVNHLAGGKEDGGKR
ncbi:carbohydrate ABC transporter permease [Paramicrobacterium fandaimingii]|uniref:carbohydrate ABC transporter permease n=1 Tax=Paramicrobacterium fandaimingii TaxID=2708079 RepID=UPI0014223735|nr:sugar ABC transporter permease [Microbacterium fandaimingii]